MLTMGWNHKTVIVLKKDGRVIAKIRHCQQPKSKHNRIGIEADTDIEIRREEQGS